MPVLGGIFNKLSPTGFYGLAKCREYVTKYMAHARPRQRVYGMLPAHERLAGAAAEETCGFAFTHPPQVGRRHRTASPSSRRLTPASDTRRARAPGTLAAPADVRRRPPVMRVPQPESAGPLSSEDEACIAVVASLFREHVRARERRGRMPQARVGRTPRPQQVKSVRPAWPAAWPKDWAQPSALARPCWTRHALRRQVDTRQLVADLTEASARPASWVRVLPTFPGAEEPPRANGEKRPRDE